MKNLLFTLKTLCLSILLSGIFILQSMENDGCRSDSGRVWGWDVSNNRFKKKPKPVSAEELKKYAEDAQDALEYNNTLCPFVNLPHEKLVEIFSYCHAHDADQVSALQQSIKNLMKISGTCKEFNNLLSAETIGEQCKHYDLDVKNKTLLKILKSINDPNYKKMRLPASILVSSGADANVTTEFQDNYLLERAIMYNDLEFAKMLLDHSADPNAKNKFLGPIFMRSKTRPMIELLVNYGLDVHPQDDLSPNVLWRATEDHHNVSADLLACYLELGVNAKLLRKGSSLLHDFAAPWSVYIPDTDNFLKKATLLLNAMPKMVNQLGTAGNTPLDCAYRTLKHLQSRTNGAPETFEQLITLLREHGCLTSQELAAQKVAATQNQVTS